MVTDLGEGVCPGPGPPVVSGLTRAGPGLTFDNPRDSRTGPKRLENGT